MRTLDSASLLGLCLAITAAWLPSPMEAQQRSGSQRLELQWVMPRTPDGHPDLQGNWNNETLTPFQRPRDQGPVLTQEHVDRIEGTRLAQVVDGAQASDPDRPPPPVTGEIGRSYNEVYFSRGDRVAVINGEPRSSLLTSPPNGRRPPLTSEAERRQRERREVRSPFENADHPELRGLTDRCLMFGSNVGPPMLPNSAYNNNYTIVQTADYVVIHAEVIHDTRIIRMGEPDPLPDHVRPWMGDSWGRWEGDVLVVETTNIYPLHTFRGIPPTPDLRVVERFTRVDENTILYAFTLEDPTTYTQPWGGEIPFRRVDHLLYEYACHEGNYALANILTSARYLEGQAAQNRPE
ncbi:MAG TPA: hypothetical protein EYQ64_13900 [Gemmatimonadetes bacterium]|nr:hypothetical protein [Gemmatimonadota bacterium]